VIRIMHGASLKSAKLFGLVVSPRLVLECGNRMVHACCVLEELMMMIMCLGGIDLFSSHLLHISYG
jgi:hypothetical protein